MNKKDLIILIIIIFILIAGAVYFVKRNKSSNTNEPQTSIVGCYVAKIARDVYALSITGQNGKEVKGRLTYNNYQKDSSQGTFDGIFENDLLLGNYRFFSEGMYSDRQVIFKKLDDSFIQGFGPVTVTDGVETFNDLNNITYNQPSTFVKYSNCNQASTFTDLSNVFTLNYSPWWAALEGELDVPTKEWRINSNTEGIILGTLYVNKVYMPETNFSDAKITIGRSTNENDIRNCTIIGQNEKYIGRTLIDNYDLSKFTTSSAGAGNIYETTSYRGILDGDCYAIEYTIHSTNISNYPANQGMKEFDKTKLINDFEETIKSIKFNLASD